MFTDSTGFFYAVNTTNIISEKQSRIKMTVVREMIDNEEIKLKWMTKEYQLADVITKKGGSNEQLGN